MNYETYMNSNAWRQKRKARLEIDNHQCRLCGETERLEVHHRPDSYALLPNETVEEHLTTLCVWCHDLITNRIRERRYASREPPACELEIGPKPFNAPKYLKEADIHITPMIVTKNQLLHILEEKRDANKIDHNEIYRTDSTTGSPWRTGVCNGQILKGDEKDN